MTADADAALATFTAARPRLAATAYRMLGSVAEAEDVLQDAWIRWSKVDEDVRDADGYLGTVVVRLCLDRLGAAARQREAYVGPWLPEPLVAAAGFVEQPHDLAAASEELTVALLLALERLSPLERAAFLLHDVFDMDFAAIASALDKAEPACRQLAARARAHLRAARPRFAASREEARRAAQLFMAAAASGDAAAIEALLAPAAVCLTDGGGKRKAALNPISGAANVARFIAGLARKAAMSEVRITEATINGLPGFVLEGLSEHPETLAIDVDHRLRIVAIYNIRNPDKLAHVRLAPGRVPSD